MSSQVVICVTGIDLPIGQAIKKRLEASNCLVQGVQSEHLNLATDALVREFRKLEKSHYIINAAELTDLEKAEKHPDLAYQYNVRSCEAVIEVAKDWGAAVLHLSSFQVFDGQKKNPYISANKGRPINAYGRTKLQSEELLQTGLEKHLILRLGWLLHTGEEGWMVECMRQWLADTPVSCLSDVELAPTAVEDVARVVDAIIKQLNCGISVWGIYHYASAEAVSHEELTRAIYYQAYGQDAPQNLLLSRHMDNAALNYVLPKNGVLGCIKLRNTFGIKQLPWRRYLPAMVEELVDRGMVKSGSAAMSDEAETTVNR
ncbi:dTDP-4-dehydrorhamnose reductase [Hahella sp. CCB-MM4]|uniref:SDR family oxidoreductase n=1 Tax=Hahella sp. (strain CCB-MM4) TaxID=1926491 RepID=UPI000B9B011C|nr:sugar nucleotide-binding protein [Hahella sp. CCB-MM4]OZG72398.1 dTDP-4-dehydrorhamnose reductase [Hahella sp. CCB-MM4]